MATQFPISNQAPYAGSRGRTVVEFVTYAEGEPEPHADTAPGAQTTSMAGRTIAWYRARYGGDVFTMRNPSTGRTHRISLKRFGDRDPNWLYVQIRFHFHPAPFASKEARLVRERTLREIRCAYEGAVDYHTGKAALRQAEAGDPTTEEMTEYCKRQASAYISLATRTGILLHHEVAAINEEFAVQYPDLFHARYIH